MKSDSKMYFRITDTDNVRIRDVQSIVQEVWREMRLSGTRAHANLEALGVETSSLPKRANDVIQVKSFGAPVGTVDLVVILLLKKVATDLWKRVILPEIENRWGTDALKRDREPAAVVKAKASGKSKAPKTKAAKKKSTAKKKRETAS